ncbi:hypothetical protein [Aneurinibacillus uraniidurans]|uniref:hypothetical protein n=1 Tax=Aneurinibacillus uraniidurans TaxID=2966586 RepID=UPI00234A428B|nr:hypothetical protein [Aneurinibacillus sp. B1]WCN38338.1 hypothetical protein PO771_02775 [Aneurinibacillus sp. B1]
MFGITITSKGGGCYGKKKVIFKGMIWLSLLCMAITLASPVQLVFYPISAYAATTPGSEYFEGVAVQGTAIETQDINDWNFSMVSNSGLSAKT